MTISPAFVFVVSQAVETLSFIESIAFPTAVLHLSQPSETEVFTFVQVFEAQDEMESQFLISKYPTATTPAIASATSVIGEVRIAIAVPNAVVTVVPIVATVFQRPDLIDASEKLLEAFLTFFVNSSIFLVEFSKASFNELIPSLIARAILRSANAPTSVPTTPASVFVTASCSLNQLTTSFTFSITPEIPSTKLAHQSQPIDAKAFDKASPNP